MPELEEKMDEFLFNLGKGRASGSLIKEKIKEKDDQFDYLKIKHLHGQK